MYVTVNKLFNNTFYFDIAVRGYSSTISDITYGPEDLGSNGGNPKQIAILMCHIPNESLWAPL